MCRSYWPIAELALFNASDWLTMSVHSAAPAVAIAAAQASAVCALSAW